ncbi:MAG TPA: hypothetical protein VHA52_00560, partial [Candidatus Babeliaceae bacterium]|nr:hypothetical protein [Candidatus Babeliaceae bacterium]
SIAIASAPIASTSASSAGAGTSTLIPNLLLQTQSGPGKKPKSIPGGQPTWDINIPGIQIPHPEILTDGSSFTNLVLSILIGLTGTWLWKEYQAPLSIEKETLEPQFQNETDLSTEESSNFNETDHRDYDNHDDGEAQTSQA